jgi:glycosyltransferase involved in cell wall biosynthesis
MSIQAAQPQTPYVSVILPTYNQADYLPAALDSIFQQTWRDFELIVVNDGSTDNTADVLADYQERYSFTVIHKQNGKLPRALNTGFEQARGKYLTWTSSDNIMLPCMLESLVQALDDNPAVGFVYADWEVIDENDELLATVRTLDHDRHLLMRINYVNACFMYRHTCQDTVGLYDPEYILAEDWEYWWRISRSFELLHIPRVLYQYRVHSGSLTSTAVLTAKRGISVGYQKLLQDFRSKPLDWYISRLKVAWMRLKLGQDPQRYLQPHLEG